MNTTKRIHWFATFFTVIVLGTMILPKCIPNSVNAIGMEMPTQTEIEEMLAMRGAEHYAYMNLEAVSKELKPVIWEARMKIIFSNSWVADETNGWVLDKNGNIIEVLPHFSDLFPDDWEIPRDPNQRYMD